ncbi:thiamine pyrophosphate-dependent enzyme [Clostridia bacterium OttesenSCG-928-O13]|nr:thiamine pyrophosphate-dependent enzyme [Clostridia bacterium OttesenSCG-928-O13]
MATKQFTTTETAWCPGCGNHAIVATLAEVLNNMGLKARDVLLVGGIGQAAKLNQYVSANGFSGLHGRALPAAVAAKMANEALTVIVNSGDGDSYGEGGNHFLHNVRRNVDITHFVHDNQVYGLTKGQVSPTSCACADLPSAACNLSMPLNPLMVALAAGATFVARAFSGKPEHLAGVMEAAIRHKGYALVDILQPCVSFNKVNTFAWYNERVYELDKRYNPENFAAAMEKSAEFGEKIPIGILYQSQKPTYHQMHPEIYTGTPLIDQKVKPDKLDALLNGYRYATEKTEKNTKEAGV